MKEEETAVKWLSVLAAIASVFLLLVIVSPAGADDSPATWCGGADSNPWTLKSDADVAPWFASFDKNGNGYVCTKPVGSGSAWGDYNVKDDVQWKLFPTSS
jgi:hypothetical protein